MTEEELSIPGVALLHQYIRSCSFEVATEEHPLVSGSVQNVKVSVNLSVESAPMGGQRYEVLTKVLISCFEVTSSQRNEVFRMNLVYAGIFELKDVPMEDIEVLLLVYCPSITFPFVRQIVAESTANAGFSQLLLDLVDFSKLYRDSDKTE